MLRGGWDDKRESQALKMRSGSKWSCKAEWGSVCMTPRNCGVCASAKASPHSEAAERVRHPSHRSL
eukprot:6471637-Amphidinium_carterae.2